MEIVRDAERCGGQVPCEGQKRAYESLPAWNQDRMQGRWQRDSFR